MKITRYKFSFNLRQQKTIERLITLNPIVAIPIRLNDLTYCDVSSSL